MYRYVRQTILLSVLASFTWLCQAQQTIPPTIEEITVPEILEYLQHDIFIEPGKGLKKIHLGMPMAQVIGTWGKPLREKTSGLSEREYQWVFRGKDGTLINVTGHKTVEKMGFLNPAGGIYETIQGARMGMLPYEITGIYGIPTGKQQKNSLFFKHRGISFGFTQGRVDRMIVEARTTPQ